MTQWHPLFAQLLRPILERYYTVETNLPVGDAPRQADIVLLRRKATKKPPFHGLWKDLTAWNVLELKGPTVSARLGDLDELVELGLGIYRRLNEECAKQKEPTLEPADISWWYLANHLGKRFLAEVPRWLGEPQPWGDGVWRCTLMQRAVYLVSRVALPVEQESLPLNLLVQETAETKRALARLLLAQPDLLEPYGPLVAGLHPTLLEEVLAMGKATDKSPKFHFESLVRLFGMKRLVEELGPKRVLEELGPKRILDEMTVEEFLAKLTPAQRRELKQQLSK
ncbi:MAG: hypothetical protein L0Z62_42395 [Gemmataceae bacterium]|nr:hypothetical protein [Gemmataceae bacterium]